MDAENSRSAQANGRLAKWMPKIPPVAAWALGFPFIKIFILVFFPKRLFFRVLQALWRPIFL